MKSLTQDQLEYIKSHERRKSPRTIARDLKLEVRDVQQALKTIRNAPAAAPVKAPEPAPEPAPIQAPSTPTPRGWAIGHELVAGGPRWLSLAIIAAIVLLGIVAYANNLHDGFHFDDSHTITANAAIQHPTFRGLYAYNLYRQVLYWTFAASWALHGPDPVGWHVENNLIHLLNGVLVFWLGLLTLRAPGARGATRWPELIAGLAALVFVLHPLQTQAVTYISQRTESLAATFYLTALIAYALARLRRLEGRSIGENLAGLPLAAGVAAVLIGATAVLVDPDHARNLFLGITAVGVLGGVGGVGWLASQRKIDGVEGALLTGALAATFFGLETKEIAGTIPFAIILWELLFTRPPGVCPLKTKPVVEKLKHFAATAPWAVMLVVLPFLAIKAGLSVKFLAAENSEEHAPGFSISGGEYLLTQLNVLATYVRLFLLPYHQTLDYDYPKAVSLTDGGGPGMAPPVVSILVVVGLVAVAARAWQRRPFLSWIVLFPLLVLLPTSSVFVIADLINEHRVYLPLAGAGLLAALVLERVVRRLVGSGPERDRLARQVFVGAAAPILLVLLILTIQRNAVWANEETLWQDCLEKAPNKPRPKTNLGLCYENSEPQTIWIKPGAEIRELSPDGHVRGYAYPNGAALGGEIGDGARTGNPSIWVVRPTLAPSRGSIIQIPKTAVVRGPLETGGTKKAAALYEEAMKLDPNYFKARNNYAMCFIQDGSWRLLESLQLRRAIQTGGLPASQTAHADELAADATEQFQKAADQLREIIRLRPRDSVAMSNLANLEFQYLDQLDDAISWMEKSVATDSSAPIVLAVLGEMHYVRAVERSGHGDQKGALADLGSSLDAYQRYLEKAGSADAEQTTVAHIRTRKSLVEQGIKSGGKLEDAGARAGDPTHPPTGIADFSRGNGPQQTLGATRFKPFVRPSPQPAPTPATGN